MAGEKTSASGAKRTPAKRRAPRRKAMKGEVPVKIMIAAMGGEGGGVLTSWLVSAARQQGLPVQATSIPGVAQRTGATTYYIEIVPTTYDKLKGQEPVLDLYPAPGDIDILVATELVEAGRMMEKGFVNPNKTTLIASSHRVYTLTEKMAMSDGRYEGDAILDAAKQMAKRPILFDMERAAQDAGSILNSVALGAMAGTGLLPIDKTVFEDGIKSAGKAVKSNLAGFAAGLAYAEGKVVEARPKAAKKAKADPTAPTGDALKLRQRIEKEYPASTHPIVMEACGRCLDYQDMDYATSYLDRLDTVRAIDDGRKDKDYTLTTEAARHLGLRMTYEDVIRVAQFKTRQSRMERVRKEVQATPDQLVKVTEFLKPGPEEIAQVLPGFIARPIVRWAEKNPARARKWHKGMYVRTDTIAGYLRLRMMAGMRRFRRKGFRYGEEQVAIESWLDLVRRIATKDRTLGLEAIECARLIKGYGDTYKRGIGNFAIITQALIEPAIAGADVAPADIKKARDAALADPEGDALSKALAEIKQGVAQAAAE